ncbi:inverse autotransporter beta domain-containing protein [Xenorhabdus szentirmaii]|uniref:Inverse autotransporter beta domain-containing protein n=2 Tax=Xenorhabdus szentirmaii TaxID=290112 RepID=A0AAW3YWQ9_9GAMM|nr:MULTISPECIES: inverse autotransporter beta domain-containing protein [unclassified Xenorhabdus]MBD2801336.1 inverse autotransporter beta domain-containing protein [Xenorhabdus sp. M]MBD2824566.1 inverse autotransporter beta domain-containing protein [Xenorhabdus sp. 5]
MDSYIYHKSIRFSVLLYSLLLPMAPMNAFSEREKSFEDKTAKETWLNSAAANTAEHDKTGVITQNIQQVSSVLSSSPSQLTEQLTEQVKSYALGKINNTIATETQKWLSQFGTARINFALDRKGKWDNSAVDLLLPLYDTKTDWLVFTQLGYRHKDSRHTLNLGLGGRYFTPNWMYGINTFFDNDVTGKNKRVGVGGEAWTDYVKLSANTYWRVSQWRQSLKGIEYEERPSNGFDINGEFYLPAYPNLGGKLAYEQYYGDNVALFNRDTTQKDPSLAKIGLNYTPIPLLTMGVDYKYGSGGKSETLFQANLNYRFGTPFETQLAPHNVASMRTLAGSRYDLVERNNNIVLEYRKKPEFNITLPNLMRGFSAQSLQTQATVISEKPVKSIDWQVEPQFLDNGGVIRPQGNHLELVLPAFNTAPDATNDYTLRANANSGDGRQRAAQMKIMVEPFVVKEKSVKQTTEGPLIANGQSAYELAASITHGNRHHPSLKGHTFSNVKWYLKPENKNATLAWDKSGKSDAQGRLTATLTSTSPLDKNTKIFLVMDGMKDAEIGDSTINFDGIKLDGEMIQTPAGPLKGNGKDAYTFKVKVLNAQNEPVKKQVISDIVWKIKDDRDSKDQVKLVAPDNPTTDDEGYLVATLTSHYGFEEIIVEAALNSSSGDLPPLLSKPVKFETIPQQAGILLKSAIAPAFEKEFPASEQERPYNVHNQLEVYLTRKLPGQTTTSPITADATGSSERIKFSVDNERNAIVDSRKGKITFPKATWGWDTQNRGTTTHNATVTADITDNTTGAKSTYTYQFNPKHYFYNPNMVREIGNTRKDDDDPSLHDPKHEIPTVCDTFIYSNNWTAETYPKDIHEQLNSRAFSEASITVLTEFVNEYGTTDSEFGIFNKDTDQNDYIIMEGTPNQGIGRMHFNYLLFNYKTNALLPPDGTGSRSDDLQRGTAYKDGTLKGRLLCLLNQHKFREGQP